jgi:hypothetical protein
VHSLQKDSTSGNGLRAERGASPQQQATYVFPGRDFRVERYQGQLSGVGERAEVGVGPEIR